MPHLTLYDAVFVLIGSRDHTYNFCIQYLYERFSLVVLLGDYPIASTQGEMARNQLMKSSVPFINCLLDCSYHLQMHMLAAVDPYQIYINVHPLGLAPVVKQT